MRLPAQRGEPVHEHLRFIEDPNRPKALTGGQLAFHRRRYSVRKGSLESRDGRQLVDHTGKAPAPQTLDFTVGEGLGGSIAVFPDPAVRSQTATLSAAATGGNPGYTFAWDLHNNGNFNDATTRTVNTTFTTTGPHVVSVRITDNDQGNFKNTHTTTITRTITVVQPTTTTTKTTPPPPCDKRVAFKLSQFTTGGCFRQTSSSPERWETTSAVKLNGIPLPDYGQRFVITGPTASEPGGHFTAANSTMQLDRFTAFSGNIDWSLPDGGAGQEKVFRSFSVAVGASIFGLNVRGTIALALGVDATGNHYATFPLSIELPASFTAGPDPGLGRVTGSASLRVDDTGIHYDGLRLEAANVWLGKIKVISTCFSYVPAGGKSTAPCATPTFGGDEPFIQCNPDATTNRWDASAVVELPSGPQLGAFGGLAGGRISKLGGYAGNLGRRVPLSAGVYLDHVAFGLCLSPPPFKIRANVGVNFLDRNLVSVDGGFTYTDATATSDWSLQLDGAVKVGDSPIGSGTLGISSRNGIDFGLKASFDVLGVASLNGQISGWIDAPRNQFVVSGSVRGCLAGETCAEADGTISSTGAAGCITVGHTLPTYDLIIPLDGSAPHLDTSTYALTAGFGYRWGASSVDLLGSSCDFSPYQPTRAAAARAAGANVRIPMRIARGTSAVSLRIHGTHGPPKVVLRGPDGSTITSPARARAKLSKGHYLLVQNKTNGTTNVMLIGPAAGVWAVSRAPGSASSPTTIDRAKLEVPPTFGARVLARGASRTVRVAYAVPVGASVRLVERAKGINRTIAASLRGHRCPGLPKMRPGTGEKILCANVRFRPSEVEDELPEVVNRPRYDSQRSRRNVADRVGHGRPFSSAVLARPQARRRTHWT